MIATDTYQPGIRFDVPFTDYLRWPLLSQSVLKEGRKSMAHLRAAEAAEVVKVPTDAMLLGSALHTAFLEPEMMPQRVVLWDGGTRRGKEWEAFVADHADQVILTPGYHEKLIGMVKALRRHPEVRKWVGRMEGTEVAAIGEVEGLMMKGRCDALTADPLVDLKMTRSADAATFTRTVMGFGYDIQAAIYRRLFDRDRFVLIAVEDTPPYDVVAYELAPAFLKRGEALADELLEKYAECKRTGAWPGRSDEVVQLEPPEWALDGCGVEITLGDASAFEE